MLRTQAALFDRLVEAVSEEFGRERGNHVGSSEKRRIERVERLLAGELVDSCELDYEFEGYHVGALAIGPRASSALRELASALDRGLMLVEQEETAWAWLGGRSQMDVEATDLARIWPPQVPLSLGESGWGVDGWRLTHRQAKAALPLALRRTAPVRYAEVAVLASILQDDLLKTSLRVLYLNPLQAGRDGGRQMRATLRAYFSARRNAAAAAAALGISRQAVNRRLQRAEQALGRELADCAVELEAVLRLEEVESVGIDDGTERGLSAGT